MAHLAAKPKKTVKAMVKKAILAIRKTVLIPVKLYQRYVSPAKGVPTCRFTPTCSQYAVDAVMEWGIFVGVILALWRLVRCNPFSKGGRDEVPKCPFHKESHNSENNNDN